MMSEPKGTSQQALDLPNDIITKILLLLPFESILSCKRLSKQWKNLINDPSFAKLYKPNGSIIVFLRRDAVYCKLTRHKNKTYSAHRLPITLEELGVRICDHDLLSSPSDGIVCVKSAGYFVTYNLFTGAEHTVNDAPLRLHPELWMHYGFGYDRFDDEYKIVLVCRYNALFDFEKAQNKETSRFWVYSANNRRWESFDGFGSLQRLFGVCYS